MNSGLHKSGHLTRPRMQSNNLTFEVFALRLKLFLLIVLTLAVPSLSLADTGSISDIGVDIPWDNWGVPHISAKSAKGNLLGSEWAQAEGHGDLLLNSVACSRGRSAEYFGPGAGGSNIKNDRWARP